MHHTTSWFPHEMTPEGQPQMLLPRLWQCFRLVEENFPHSSDQSEVTTHIRVVTHHQYGISPVVPQTGNQWRLSKMSALFSPGAQQKVLPLSSKVERADLNFNKPIVQFPALCNKISKEIQVQQPSNQQQCRASHLRLVQHLLLHVCPFSIQY